MEVQTLSTITTVPFNNTFERFFQEYTLSEDVECYQLIFSPYNDGTIGTSFEDLNQINFQSRVVILNVIDSIIDANDNIDIDGLTQFCLNHPEQNFIVSSPHLGLSDKLNVPNLYLETLMPTTFTGQYLRCEKTDITNNWIALNSNPRLHRVLTVCYLLSKDYYRNGNITFEMRPILYKEDSYKNIDGVPDSFISAITPGYARFKEEDFNRLELASFVHEDNYKVLENYHDILLPAYHNTAIEIISGSLFFENVPTLSEKEMQSVYGKNFPIYINGVGMAREMKNLFDIDIFDDIIDHSYDEIEDHFERLTAAIDRNEHLLDGSTNISELWYDNQDRLNDNCDKLDAMLFNGEYQKVFNDQKIKQALTHFGVSSELIA